MSVVFNHFTSEQSSLIITFFFKGTFLAASLLIVLTFDFILHFLFLIYSLSTFLLYKNEEQWMETPQKLGQNIKIRDDSRLVHSATSRFGLPNRSTELFDLLS